MARTVLFLFAISLLICAPTFTQSACEIDQFDITNLTFHWGFDVQDDNLCIYEDEAFCHFYFTFCNTLPDVKESTCVNSSVCQVTNSEVNEIGHYVENPFVKKEVNGFLAKFTSTRSLKRNKAIKDERNCTSISVTFDFDCDKNALWIPGTGIETKSPPPKFFNLTETDTSCDYFIQFDYAGACTQILPTTTTTTMTAPSKTTSFYNPTPSKLCVPPSRGYEISNLTSPSYWIFNIKEGCALETNSSDACTLLIAFCKPIENVIDCDGAGSCLRYPNQPGSTTIVGNYTVDPFYSFYPFVNNSFEANYPGGALIYNLLAHTYCYVSLRVNFQCDSNAYWEVPEDNEPGVGPLPLLFEPITASSCELKMIVPYSGACTKERDDTIILN